MGSNFHSGIKVNYSIINAGDFYNKRSVWNADLGMSASLSKELELGVIIKNKQLNIEDISTNTIVNEAPVFKIFIGKHDNGTGELMEFKELNNEIIYSYEGRKETKYAVGFYKNEKEANKNLPKYKNLIKESEIVGLYKGIIISLKLANELLEQFNKNYLPSKH